MANDENPVEAGCIFGCLFWLVAIPLFVILAVVGLININDLDDLADFLDPGNVWLWVLLVVADVLSTIFRYAITQANKEQRQRQLRVDYLIARGMSPSEAEQQVEREFRDRKKKE